jgi:hypothetical protein
MPEVVDYPHGAPEYYLAVATVIPVLLIAYLFSMNSLDAIKKLIKDDAGIMLIIAGVVLPLLAISAAILGEVQSLRALFGRDPSSANAWCSSAGLVAFPVVGVLHLIILEGIDRRNERRDARAEPVAAPEPPVVASESPVVASEPRDSFYALAWFKRSWRR